MRKNISWNLVSKYRTELMGCSILGIILFHWYENCMIHGKSINFTGEQICRGFFNIVRDGIILFV